MTTQRRDTPYQVGVVEIREAIEGLMESLEYYAKPEEGWDEVAHANAFEEGKAVIRALESASVTQRGETPEALMAGVREALQQIVDDAVGAPTDPLMIVQREMILAGIVALQNDEDTTAASASVIAELHPHLENMADALREKAAMEQSQRAIESFIAEWRERASHIYDFSAKAIAERKEETLDFSACVGITLVLDDLSGLLSRLQGANK